MENKRPLILISNDDGYQAKGLNCLIDMVAHLGDIVVCAPDGPRSGLSCAFSATTPLLLTHHPSVSVSRNSVTAPSVDVWSCNGTPTDCVKMALSQIVDRKPAIVVGGINHGDNASVNSHYSGTMGVVMEGCMKYIPSVAFSLCDHDPDADFEPLRPYVERYTRYVLEHGLPKGVCLNINFPKLEAPTSESSLSGPSMPAPCAGQYNGVRVCRMAHGSWLNEVTTCHHPRGYDYYWMVGNYRNDEPEAEDTDRWALDHGYVAITPTTFDVTAYEALQSLKTLES
jgi:5'-nucleotidase